MFWFQGVCWNKRRSMRPLHTHTRFRLIMKQALNNLAEIGRLEKCCFRMLDIEFVQVTTWLCWLYMSDNYELELSSRYMITCWQHSTFNQYSRITQTTPTGYVTHYLKDNQLFRLSSLYLGMEFRWGGF